MSATSLLVGSRRFGLSMAVSINVNLIKGIYYDMVDRTKIKLKPNKNPNILPFDRGDSVAFAWKRAQSNPQLLNEFYRQLLKAPILVPVIEDKVPARGVMRNCKSRFLMAIEDSVTLARTAPFFTSRKAAEVGSQEITKVADLDIVPFIKDNVENFFREVLRLGYQAHMNFGCLNPKIVTLVEIETILRLKGEFAHQEVQSAEDLNTGGEPNPESRPAEKEDVSQKIKKKMEPSPSFRALEGKIKELRILLDQTDRELENKDWQIKQARLETRSALEKVEVSEENYARLDEKYKNSAKSMSDKTDVKIAPKKQYYESKIALLKDELNAARNDLELVKRPWKWPDSLEDVLSMGLDYFGDRLIYHEDLVQTAHDYASAREGKMIRDAWEMISALGQSMFRMKFIDGIFSEKIFTDETGIELAMTEGRQTKNNKIFERYRTFTFQGQAITSYAHVKGSGDLRLYFHILEKERRILIYHLGEHLPNSQTKALK